MDLGQCLFRIRLMTEKFKGKYGAGDEGRERPMAASEGMTRREFLKRTAPFALGGASALFGKEVISRTVEGAKPYVRELARYKEHFERVVSESVTFLEFPPEPGKLSEFVNFDIPKIQLDRGIASRLTEYWRTQFTEKDNSGKANPAIREAFIRMRPWDDLVKKEFISAGVPAELRLIAIQPESQFRLEAKSRSGARGPFQVMPGTARRHGIEPQNIGLLHDAEVSAGVSARYLRELYDGIADKQQPLRDWDLVLSAYNGAFIWGYAESTREPLSYDGFLRYMGERTSEMRVAIKKDQYFHAVVKNQTPFAIAGRYGMTIAELIAANPKLRKSFKLKAGERIKIPIRNEARARQVFNIVAAGIYENLNYVPKFRALMDIVKREGEERLFASAPQDRQK